MLIYKIQRLITRIGFFLRFLFWKLIYGKNLIFPLYYKSCIDPGAIIKNIGGVISFKGKFNCRRNLTINVLNGYLSIGNNVFFNQGVSINCQGKITIGDFSLFGEDVKIYDHNHRFSAPELIMEQGFSIKDVNIGSNVWLGSNVVILSGVNIGDNAIISAGSIVREDVPENMILKSGMLIKIIKENLSDE
ncbi:acyltransferase [Enterobacter cancerogenus]|uniref:acyltransferase n=1 Tax=Enterobacter cancerogenus TaxID=69218 RepID=UPI003820959E